MQNLYEQDDEKLTVKRFNQERLYHSEMEQPLVHNHQGSLKNSKITVPLYRSSQLSAKKYVPRYSIKIQCHHCDFYGYSQVEERKNIYIKRFTLFAMLCTLALFVTGILFINSGFTTAVEVLLYTNISLLGASLGIFWVMMWKSGHRIDHHCMKCHAKF
jgi:hypothetical protein